MRRDRPAGWVDDPHDPTMLRWWNGAQLTDSRRRKASPWRAVAPLLVAATLTVLIGAVIGGVAGFGAFLAFAGAVALVVGLIAVVRGGLRGFLIPNRRVAALVTGLALVLFAGGTASAQPSGDRPVGFADGSRSGSSTPSADPAPVRTSTLVTEQVVVPFGLVTVDDPAMLAGTSQVTTAGVEGVVERVYRLTFVDGVEVRRNLVSETVLVAAVDEVTSVGTMEPPRAAPPPQPSCHPSYEGACVPFASDVDCAGGSGNGPAYVAGPVRVVGPDVYDLDRDGDGIACDR